MIQQLRSFFRSFPRGQFAFLVIANFCVEGVRYHFSGVWNWSRLGFCLAFAGVLLVLLRLAVKVMVLLVPRRRPSPEAFNGFPRISRDSLPPRDRHSLENRIRRN
jgi:hypothetical protein